MNNAGIFSKPAYAQFAVRLPFACCIQDFLHLLVLFIQLSEQAMFGVTDVTHLKCGGKAI